MQRTVKLKLEEDKDLINTIREYSLIKQWVCDIGLKKKSYNKNELHNWTYKKLKKQYPNMPTGILQTARDVASETLKRTKLKKKINGKEFSSMRLDKRNLRVSMENNKISISSINGRKKLTFKHNPMSIKYIKWSAVAGTLCYKKNQLYLNVVLEIKTQPQIVVDRKYPDIVKIKNGLTHLNLTNQDDIPEELNVGRFVNKDIVGIDRGIINIAVLSNNQFFHSRHLKNIKGKYQYLKEVLQNKGTKSATRKLQKISRKETRFVSDVNHCLSKTIANSDFKVFCFETLKIKKKKRTPEERKKDNIFRSQEKAFNKKLNGWSFGQLEKFVTYKIENKGKIIVKAPINFPSSQICSCCGYKDKANRNRSKFKCLKCDFELHSDLNASRNLANFGKSEISRLLVNQPIVALEKSFSYKPINSLMGN